MKTSIKTLAEKAGLALTSKGNLELGSDDQGSHGTPGSHACNSAVSYYLTPSGDVRAVIDNRSGSNQGYIEWQYGDVTKMDGADLDEAIQLAKDHAESLDDADLMRAWRIASSEARATMRKIEAADADADGLPAELTITVEIKDAEMAKRVVDSLIEWECNLRAGNGVSGHIPVTAEVKLADSIRDARRNLQEVAKLVVTPA